MSVASLPLAVNVLDEDEERLVGRRVTTIWGLLVFNVLAYSTQPTVFPISHRIGSILTQGALALAFVLALTVNRRLVVRPNLLLTLASILACSSLAVSIRGEVSRIGSDYRAGRLIVFVIVLWLLTPWWGRKDFLIPRFYVRCLVVILASTVIGFALSPHTALAFGRYSGALWPIPPTQVAHYAAEVAGLSGVMWLAGIMKPRNAAILFAGALGILVLTHTRTALIALLVALCVAALSLFAWKRRVRRVLIGALIVLLVVGLTLLPVFATWFTRGENSQELSDLSGRTLVWSALVTAPRTEAQIIFGFGMSNNGFNGLPIDNSWLAVYQDQGLFGDVICGLMLLSLMILAGLRPRSPARAMAIFILVYCTIASFTETGLGEPSTYMLDLAVAASLLSPDLSALLRRPRPDSELTLEGDVLPALGTPDP